MSKAKSEALGKRKKEFKRLGLSKKGKTPATEGQDALRKYGK